MDRSERSVFESREHSEDKQGNYRREDDWVEFHSRNSVLDDLERVDNEEGSEETREENEFRFKDIFACMLATQEDTDKEDQTKERRHPVEHRLDVAGIVICLVSSVPQ